MRVSEPFSTNITWVAVKYKVPTTALLEDKRSSNLTFSTYAKKGQRGKKKKKLGCERKLNSESSMFTFHLLQSSFQHNIKYQRSMTIRENVIILCNLFPDLP